MIKYEPLKLRVVGLIPTQRTIQFIMTRVNLVSVEDLADQHLFAEGRELKMIPAKVRKLWLSNTVNIISMRVNSVPEYTMSTGHVTFFYDKIEWLYRRHLALTEELEKRKFNISNYDSYLGFHHGIPGELIGNWKPTIREIKINVGRISERLHQRPTWYRYYGEIKSPEFFIEKYTQQLFVDTIIA